MLTEVVLVGTGDAFGAAGRRQSGVFVRTGSGGVLLDVSGTALTGLNELGIERGEVDTVMISHFHADHFGGLPGLLIAMLYEDHRTEPLRIAGPAGVEDRVREAARALGHPIDDRQWRFKIEFSELEPGKPSQLGPVAVVPFQTHHNPEADPQGYVLASDNKRIAYSGDTGWFDALPEMVKGVDLFVCECTQVKRAYEYHLSLEELLEHEKEFDLGEFVLTHLGTEMAKMQGRSPLPIGEDGLKIRI